jgi:DNA-binding response OmpR family regulator
VRRCDSASAVTSIKSSFKPGLERHQQSFSVTLIESRNGFMLTKTTHIMVVDDNQDVLTALSFILGRNAYKVSAKSRFNNFEREMELLEPDLVLLDKSLGWADGCDLCRTIKANKKMAAVPVIMFSAYYKIKDECLEAGADGFIEKPFEIQALLSAIRLVEVNSAQQPSV